MEYIAAIFALGFVNWLPFHLYVSGRKREAIAGFLIFVALPNIGVLLFIFGVISL